MSRRAWGNAGPPRNSFVPRGRRLGRSPSLGRLTTSAWRRRYDLEVLEVALFAALAQVELCARPVVLQLLRAALEHDLAVLHDVAGLATDSAMREFCSTSRGWKCPARG